MTPAGCRPHGRAPAAGQRCAPPSPRAAPLQQLRPLAGSAGRPGGTGRGLPSGRHSCTGRKQSPAPRCSPPSSSCVLLKLVSRRPHLWKASSPLRQCEGASAPSAASAWLPGKFRPTLWSSSQKFLSSIRSDWSVSGPGAQGGNHGAEASSWRFSIGEAGQSL